MVVLTSGGGDRHQRPLWVSPPVPGQTQRQLGAGIGNLRPGSGAGRIHPRTRPGRDCHHRPERTASKASTTKCRPIAQAFCIFEFIYFARPDSTFFGRNVYQTRKAHGRRLAEEAPVDADLVMPFPDSGTYAALGYSEASGIPFEMGMIRNHYVGRTFIQPTQSMRDFGVRVKLNPIKELLKGKDIIIIEDSIIRGTTVKTRVKALARTGGQRVHMRVSGPAAPVPLPLRHRFFNCWGVDRLPNERGGTPQFLGLDSLYYLSLEGLLESTGVRQPDGNFCKACFDGCYPVQFDENLSKNCME
jgi:amidophosphoribosyltransferase